MATGTSTYSMPAAKQASTSFCLMGREALVMSLSPLQNFLKPPPLPERPTVTLTLPPVRMPNSSATASLTG